MTFFMPAGWCGGRRPKFQVQRSNLNLWFLYARMRRTIDFGFKTERRGRKLSR